MRFLRELRTTLSVSAGLSSLHQHAQGVGGSAARQARCRCAGDGPLSVDQEVDERTEEYNRRMQQQMGWDARPFEYHYGAGSCAPGLTKGLIRHVAETFYPYVHSLEPEKQPSLQCASRVQTCLAPVWWHW